MDCPGSAEENVALTPAKAVTPDGGLRISDFPAALTPLLSELDDSGDGVLDIEELTEMCTVYISMKRAAADGSIAISSLPKELHGALEAFDVDGDGSVAPVELARAAELYKKSKQKSKNLTRAVAGLTLVLILLVAAIVGMTAQVIEMSKETTTSANGVTTVAGSNKPAATGQVGEQTGLMEAFRLPPTELDAVKSLYFPEGEGATCEADTYCNGGTELSYTVTGWARNHEAGLTFYTARGDTINVKETGDITVTTSTNDVILSISAGEEAGRRRRLGFFSAIMTSGSFTMMQAGSF